MQISLLSSLDPSDHLRIGRTLSPLDNKGVLILGSGMSYGNMQRLVRQDGPILESDRFDA